MHRTKFPAVFSATVRRRHPAPTTKSSAPWDKRQSGVTGSSDASHRAGFWYSTIDLVTSVEQIEDELLPTEFRLEQNYPNPFNPSTTIRFALPKTSNVTIKIYDVLGRQVATLVDEKYQPGVYKIIFEAGELASGLYIYRIQTQSFTQSRKLMLLK